MTLDDLLNGNESGVSDWLRQRELLHECNCGYTVYDTDKVISAVQKKWGDHRSREIRDWVYSLANDFGWLWMEASVPGKRMYFCQHCNAPE